MARYDNFSLVVVNVHTGAIVNKGVEISTTWVVVNIRSILFLSILLDLLPPWQLRLSSLHSHLVTLAEILHLQHKIKHGLILVIVIMDYHLTVE